MKPIKNKQLWTSALVGAVIAGGALAGNVTLPYVFQPNTPARASEVNANFSAVKAAVDDNHARLARVETELDPDAGILPDGGVRIIADLNNRTGINSVAISTLQGSVAMLQTADSQNWKRGGNVGTNIMTDYLGTADNQGLEFRVNASRAMQILPTASAPNFLLGGNQCPATIHSSAKGVIIAGGNAVGRLTLCTSRTTERHRAYDNNTVVLGGYGNVAGTDDADTTNSESAVVVGGVFNSATGYVSSVLGGDSNAATGYGASIPGGLFNQASGTSSVALGSRANSAHNYSFVFSDGSAFSSSAASQFAVHASGGVYFGAGSVTTATMPAGAFIATSTGANLSTGGTWTNSSDVAMKTNLQPVDGKKVLERVRAMPIYTWNYKSDKTGALHMGPTAQDFAAQFALGHDDKHIATVDADGVALAAVQGLAELLEKQQQLIEKQQRELDDLRSRLQEIERNH